MLYPDDKDIAKFFSENDADIVGLSAVVSTSYLQVKRISKFLLSFWFREMIVTLFQSLKI